MRRSPPTPMSLLVDTGEREFGLAGGAGRGTCCPGKHRSIHPHTHTRDTDPHNLPIHSMERQRGSLEARGHWKSPAQEVGHCHLRVGGAVRISWIMRLGKLGGNCLRLTTPLPGDARGPALALGPVTSPTRTRPVPLRAGDGWGQEQEAGQGRGVWLL